MKKYLISLFLIIALSILLPVAGAQSWDSYGGSYFAGEMNVDLTLVQMETDWSIPDFVGNAWWDASISGDGAVVMLCRDMLYYNGAPLSSGGCTSFIWSPSGHAYISIGSPIYDLNEVAILIINSDVITLIEGIGLIGDDTPSILLNSPLWIWEHQRAAKIEVGPENLR